MSVTFRKSAFDKPFYPLQEGSILDRYLILIIDDDQTQHLILGEYLKQSGYEVIHAKDGAQGLRMTEAHKPDLILLDLQMPVMDGFKTLEMIRSQAEFQDTPVLLLTSLNRERLKIRGLEMGADDYITKPFNKAELLARLKAALRRVVRKRSAEGMLKGDLSDIGLSDLLQSMELGSKTASIFMEEIDSAIFIENGALVHARQGVFTGNQALIRIFLLEKGAFSVKFNELPAAISKEEPRSLTSVLMGILAEVDEIRDIIGRIRAEKLMLEIGDDITEFPSIARLREFSPISFINLMVLMEGDVKDNLKTLIMASKKKKLKVIN